MPLWDSPVYISRKNVVDSLKESGFAPVIESRGIIQRDGYRVSRTEYGLIITHLLALDILSVECEAKKEAMLLTYMQKLKEHGFASEIFGHQGDRALKIIRQ